MYVSRLRRPFPHTHSSPLVLSWFSVRLKHDGNDISIYDHWTHCRFYTHRAIYLSNVLRLASGIKMVRDISSIPQSCSRILSSHCISSTSLNMIHLALLLSAFALTAAYAKNDWSKPCLAGSCSYDLSGNKIGFVRIVSARMISITTLKTDSCTFIIRLARPVPYPTWLPLLVGPSLPATLTRQPKISVWYARAKIRRLHVAICS